MFGCINYFSCCPIFKVMFVAVIDYLFFVVFNNYIDGFAFFVKDAILFKISLYFFSKFLIGPLSDGENIKCFFYLVSFLFVEG